MSLHPSHQVPLLLDEGTYLPQSLEVSAAQGPNRPAQAIPSPDVVVFVVGWFREYPDGGIRVVLQTSAASPSGTFKSNGTVRSSAVRATERSKRVLDDFIRWHGICEMWTLTSRPGDSLTMEEEQAATSREFQRFFERFKRRVGESPGPYLVVEEFGKLNGRRHFHNAADWRRRFGAVEVCEVCALPSLRRVRADIPPAGSVCIGCLWGHGFVGAPQGSAPGSLSQYLSKYMVADMVGPGALGKHRFRASAGFRPPEPARIEGWTFEGVAEHLEEMLGVRLEWWDSLHKNREMPRTVIGNFHV